MVQLPLNFAVFYQCAIEGHTSLFKSEAVSILLLGIPKAMDKDKVLTPSNISTYVSGQSRIKDTVVTQLLSIPVVEAERRIKLLGIQDIGAVAYSLKRLVAKVELGPSIRLRLSEAYRNGFLQFVAEVFLTAIKYPPKNVHKLSQDEKDAIASCWAELDTIETGIPLSPSVSEPSSGTIASSTEEQGRKMSPEEIEQMLSGIPIKKHHKNDAHDTASAAVSRSSKSTGPKKITQEEIERMLNGIAVEDSLSKEGDADRNPPNILYISPLKQSGANEAINILLSAGITSFTNLFDNAAYAGLPHFDFYEDQSLVNKLLFGDEDRITVLHRFTPVQLSSLGIVEGHIAIALNRDCFMDYWKEHLEQCSLQFFSTKERGEYKGSMSGEMGSIFTCSAVTALSSLISEAFTVEPSDMLSIKKLMGTSSPMFVGRLPFHFSTYSFETYLLLGWQSAHVLMDRLQQLLGE